MKEDLAILALLILVADQLVQQRLNWKLLVSAVALGLLIIPVNEQYRQELRSGHADTVERKYNVLAQSAQAAAQSDDYLQSAEESAVNRLDLFGAVHFLVDYPDIASLRYQDLNVIDYIVYPFTPRFLWPEKPVLDVGGRLSVAMGSPDTTSTAVTPFGWLLISGGMLAVAIGMFLFGLAAQWFSNMVAGYYDSKTLFIYVCFFRLLVKPEVDFLYVYGTIVQNVPLIMLTASAVYGGSFWRLTSQTKQIATAGPKMPAVDVPDHIAPSASFPQAANQQQS